MLDIDFFFLTLDLRVFYNEQYITHFFMKLRLNETMHITYKYSIFIYIYI